jgi:hypothetical protein
MFTEMAIMAARKTAKKCDSCPSNTGSVVCPYAAGLTEDFGMSASPTDNAPHCQYNGFKPPGEICSLTPVSVQLPYEKPQQAFQGECGKYFDQHFKLLSGEIKKL